MGDNIGNISDTISKDLSLSSHFALRVALQTMKERCLSLQKRLTLVEEENFTLRNRIEIDFPSNISEQSELRELRKQVTDLSQQKLQLNEHITMVATENRQLWSRLSQMSKDRLKNNECENKISSSATLNGQNLIRSKTFTQHSPNPNLRHRNPEDIGNIEQPLDDLSLEEVELINYFDNKTTIDKQLNNNDILNKNSLGFGYLNDETGSGESEIIMDSRKCIDGMQEIERTLLKQQNDLKQVLSNLQKKLVLQECVDCKKLKKPETADKSLETDESLIEGLKNTTPQTSTENQLQQSFEENDIKFTNNHHIDIINQKRLADEMDKICPLCGKIYSNEIPFDDFQKHVELHFIDENELDSNQIERNFEMVSHTVGDF